MAKVAMACAINTWGSGTSAHQHTAHRLMAKKVNSQRMCMFNCARRSSSSNKLLITFNSLNKNEVFFVCGNMSHCFYRPLY